MATIEINNTELNLYFTTAQSAGYGHKKITVELELNGDYKKFSATTSSMPDYDSANELEGEEKDEAYYNLIASKIEDEVIEWIDEN